MSATTMTSFVCLPGALCSERSREAQRRPNASTSWSNGSRLNAQSPTSCWQDVYVRLLCFRAGCIRLHMQMLTCACLVYALPIQPDSGTTGFQCREAFGHLVGEIYFLLMQTTQNFPAAYPSTIRTLKEHAKTLSSLATERKLKMSGVSNIRVTAMAIFQLREIIGVLDGTKPLDTTVHSNSVVPWAGCELIVIADESSHWKGITAADCEELKEGEDMKACARVSLSAPVHASLGWLTSGSLTQIAVSVARSATVAEVSPSALIASRQLGADLALALSLPS